MDLFLRSYIISTNKSQLLSRVSCSLNVWSTNRILSLFSTHSNIEAEASISRTAVSISGAYLGLHLLTLNLFVTVAVLSMYLQLIMCPGCLAREYLFGQMVKRTWLLPGCLGFEACPALFAPCHTFNFTGREQITLGLKLAYMLPTRSQHLQMHSKETKVWQLQGESGLKEFFFAYFFSQT